MQSGFAESVGDGYGLAAGDTGDPEHARAYLASNGECIYLGEFTGYCGGLAAIFRHRQLNGSQVLTVYGHLERVDDLQVGVTYPIMYPLGLIKQDLEHTDPFLHFAMAYGGTWQTDLRDRPVIPLNVGASWIKDRYQNPFNLMTGGFGAGPKSYPAS